MYVLPFVLVISQLFFLKLSYSSSKEKESTLSLYYDITILHTERQVNVITSVHCHIVNVKFNNWLHVHIIKCNLNTKVKI